MIRLGLIRVAAFSRSLRHGRSYMSAHDAPGSARPFLCRNFHSVSKLPSCQSQYKKRLTIRSGASCFHVIRLGFEPKTHSLEGCCSIQLSYRTCHCNQTDCKDNAFYFNGNMLRYRVSLFFCIIFDAASMMNTRARPVRAKAMAPAICGSVRA